MLLHKNVNGTLYFSVYGVSFVIIAEIPVHTIAEDINRL